MATPGCTLQINVAPGDWQHFQHTFPHQLRQLRSQVDHVLVIVDLEQPSGRYARSAHEGDRERLLEFLDGLRSEDAGILVRPVDTRHEMRAALAMRFFDSELPPLRDAHGGPYHAYLQGLLDAPTDAVFHLDSDMLLGGGSTTWVAEALRALDDHPDLLLCSPLAGPPVPTGRLPPDVVAMHAGAQRFGSTPSQVEGELAYRFRHASTRSFLTHRERLEATGLVGLNARAGLLDWQARRKAAPLEVALSGVLRRHGLQRLDMLGRPPGLWVLHPHVRTPAFYAGLHELIRKVEQGLVPDDQRGYFDLRRSLLDWGPDPARFDGRPSWRRHLSNGLRRTPLRSVLERRARGFG